MKISSSLKTWTAVLSFIVPAASSATILAEDFEGGSLDPRISLTSIGGFASTPGVKPLTNFGSASAFGFGSSFCPFNCFDAHVSSLTINLGSSTFVSTLAFDEMELFGNWGSGGAIFLDGALFGTTHFDYGRLPYNDLIADQTFRSQSFALNQAVTTIELRVRDITNLSEVFIDNLVVEAGTVTVPEPEIGVLMLVGVCAWRWRALGKCLNRSGPAQP
jgi:hypothetical protein